VGSLEKRLEALEERIEPPEESKWRATRQEYAERLGEMARIYRREGEAIKYRTAMLQEQGHSHQDAQTIAKDEVVHAENPELWNWLNRSSRPS
jgi:hypothetical protein